MKHLYAILGEGRPAKRRPSDCMAKIFRIEDAWGQALLEKRKADWQAYARGFKKLAAACAVPDTEAIAAILTRLAEKAILDAHRDDIRTGHKVNQSGRDSARKQREAREHLYKKARATILHAPSGLRRAKLFAMIRAITGLSRTSVYRNRDCADALKKKLLPSH